MEKTPTTGSRFQSPAWPALLLQTDLQPRQDVRLPQTQDLPLLPFAVPVARSRVSLYMNLLNGQSFRDQYAHARGTLRFHMLPNLL